MKLSHLLHTYIHSLILLPHHLEPGFCLKLKTMNAIHVDDEIDSEFQQFLESQVYKILHDFDEFENETLQIVVGSSNPVFTNDKDNFRLPTRHPTPSY